MTTPKRHHYVPRFYLERFANARGILWVFDKHTDRIFGTRAGNVALELGFYEAPELQGTETEVVFLERQFSDLEAEAAQITACWLRQVNEGDLVAIPEVNRHIMSLYIATQLFRTAAQRAILKEFLLKQVNWTECAEDELKNVHARLLCGDLVANSASAIEKFIWVFVRNYSDEPFYSSDHPIALKSGDNKYWLATPRIFDEGVQITFPLSPTVMLYCHEPNHWRRLAPFDCGVSPVRLTSDMVTHENSGQVGMSNRFVFSSMDDFSFARSFCDAHPEIRDPARDRFYL